MSPLSRSFFDRLRTRRLASTFAALIAVSLPSWWILHRARGSRAGQAGQQLRRHAAQDSQLHGGAQCQFAQIAKQVGPAVVNINTRTLPKQSANPKMRINPHGNMPQCPVPQSPMMTMDGGSGQAVPQGPDSPGFQDFFNRFFGGQGDKADEGEDQGAERDSLGSGFIVDPKGYIITNNHVVEKADEIYVKLSTDPDTTDLGRKARVIGVDKATDLAVIKIDTDKPLPTVKLGNSDRPQVGDWVIAIGSPFSLSQTVTAGIISAKNRTIEPGVAEGSSSTSSRPTRPSIRATPAGRCSI
jgi:serine protease Do